jgi:HAD superfamily hydrolase (TIGR01549 family)
LRRPRAIFFDVGGVLVSHSGWRVADARLDEELRKGFPDLDIQRLHDVWAEEWSRQHEIMFKKGFETMRSQAEKSLQRALARLGCKSNAMGVRRLLDTWYKVAERNAESMPDAKEVLMKLSDSGYRIGIITNADWNVVIPQLRCVGLLKYVDYKIVSSRLRSYKPNMRNFREAIRASKLKSEEIMFVGDSVEVDVEPAERIGMIGLLMSKGDGGEGTISGLKELPGLLHRTYGPIRSRRPAHNRHRSSCI